MKKQLARQFVLDYIREAQRLLGQIETTTGTASSATPFEEGINVLGTRLHSNHETSRRQVFLIGNGGSAGIASEVANRFWKFCRLPAQTFNDSVLLTSVVNDHGVNRMFAEPLEVYGQLGDILVAISSSGQSENIHRAVETARSKSFGLVVTLSGFRPDNPLRTLGDLNFYVPSDSYRHVERTHLFILDCLIDLLIVMQSRGEIG